MDSKGDVRRVFLACVLHALGSNPAGVRVFRNCASKGHLPMVLLAGEESHGRYHCCFLWIPKVTFGEFFWLVFCMPWARILLVFECFGTVPPRTFANGFASWRGISRAIPLFFFMDSKGNVRRVFLACVLHALGSNPAGVRVFQNCASKGHLPLVKVTFAEFFWLVFCMPWAGILLAFKCFGTVPPRDICQWFC